MSNLIQIKRSQTTAQPASLANGELAWTSAGNTLFIGNYGTVLAIGGSRSPGVLTANQALVADGNGSINFIKTANLQVQSITDSTGVYSPGAGFLLAVDGSGKTYWEDPTTVGVGPEYVQNTDSRVLSGNLHFTGANTYIDNLYSPSSTITNLTVNGNTVIGSSIIETVTINAAINSNLIPETDATYDLGVTGATWNEIHGQSLFLGSSEITGGAGNTINVGSLNVNNNITANVATFYHSITVGGDLYVTGNVVSTNVDMLTVQTPLLHLGTNNHTSDSLDIGFFSDYYNGSNVAYTGLVRDASDKVYKLFYGLTDEPITYVNTASASFKQATLEAYLISGALTSNSTQLDITATNGLAVAIQANTLTLSTALGYQSGGTGFKSYSQGDLLVGNSTSGIQKLALGASGYVLQSDGTNLIYSTLDGGTF
jgi:hypothetical protein